VKYFTEIAEILMGVKATVFVIILARFIFLNLSSIFFLRYWDFDIGHTYFVWSVTT